MKSTNNFTMIPNDNKEFYARGFNILHAYIVERVRSFENNGMTCYLSNEQFAEATGSSVSTVKRAIKLLIDEKVLWAGYRQKELKNKKRVLRIFNEAIAKSEVQNELVDFISEVQNEPMVIEDDITEAQNEPTRGSNCTDERFKMNPTEVQNEPLIYKENIKENNNNKNETSSQSDDCSMAHEPEARSRYEDDFSPSLFGGVDLALPTDPEQSFASNTSLDFASLSWAEKMDIVESVELGMWDGDEPFWCAEYRRLLSKKLRENGNPEEGSMVYCVVESQVRRELEDMYS